MHLSIFYFKGSQVKISKFFLEKNMSQKNLFIIANSADPEMPHHLATNVRLSLIILMNFHIHGDTISMGVSILYFKGQQVEISIF